MNKFTFNFIILSTFFMLCQAVSGQSLTRPQAAQMIVAFYEQPNVSYYKLNIANPEVILAKLKPLVSQGLVYVDESKPLWEYALTQSGKQYAVKNSLDVVALGINCFKEVTGIKYTNANETSAIVEYSVSITNVTPFGIHMKLRDGIVYNYSVKMDKYDDGWRIVGTRDNRKISDVPFYNNKGINAKNCCSSN